MAFLCRCVIHKSGPRIWRKLMSFGLHPNPCGQAMTARNGSNHICTIVDRGTFFNERDDKLGKLSAMPYDCGENEDLFFALAALRDDSDIYQWFIYDNRAWNDDNPMRCWFICKQESIEDDMCYDQIYSDCEKASMRELIEHFNRMDDDEIVINQQ